MMATTEKASIDTGKEVAHYSAVLAGWTSTRIEFDKSKLTLSVAGIGLLVTLLTTIGIDNYAGFVLYVFAIISFLVTITCVLIIFQRNAKHLEKVITEDEKSDSVLRMLDTLSSFSFLTAVLFSMAIGLSQGMASIHTGQEKCMTEEKEDTVQVVTSKKSLEGLGKLKPSDSGGDSASSESSESSNKDE